MKKLLALTTSFCAAVIAAASFGGTAAFADDAPLSGIDYYPKEFSASATFDNLEDYAVGENKYAFLENNVIFEYDGKNFYGFEDGNVTATAVYYKNGTVLCYGNDEGIFEHATQEKAGIIPDTENPFYINSYGYYEGTSSVKVTYYHDGEQDEPITLEGFSKLKKFGNTAYAVKDNALYKFEGANYEPVSLSYLDYSPTKKINVGTAAQALKEFSLQSPVFVTLKNGAFMTEIDIDKLEGNFFAAGKTYKAGTDIPEKTAILLATAGAEGKISIVMICGEGGKSKCYLTHSDNATVTEREAVTEKELGATVTVNEAFIYSAPYVCKSTQLKDIKSGDPLKVIGEVSKADNPELVRDFYKVEFTAESGVTVGYVPFEYVSLFTFIENDPAATPDPDYSEDNVVKEVLLVLVVVVLVLAAGGYIVYVLTSDKAKKQNKEK